MKRRFPTHPNSSAHDVASPSSITFLAKEWVAIAAACTAAGIVRIAVGAGLEGSEGEAMENEDGDGGFTFFVGKKASLPEAQKLARAFTIVSGFPSFAQVDPSPPLLPLAAPSEVSIIPFSKHLSLTTSSSPSIIGSAEAVDPSTLFDSPTQPSSAPPTSLIPSTTTSSNPKKINVASSSISKPLPSTPTPVIDDAAAPAQPVAGPSDPGNGNRELGEADLGSKGKGKSDIRTSGEPEREGKHVSMLGIGGEGGARESPILRQRIQCQVRKLF